MSVAQPQSKRANLPPGPRRRVPGANFLAFRRNPAEFFVRMAREYGDFVHFRIGPRRLFLLNHPDHVRDLLVTQARNFTKGETLQRGKILLGEGLLTSEGEFHLRQRRLAQPAFHRQRISSYAEVMARSAARACERWQNGALLDLHKEMMRLTLAIVGKTLFDADVEAEADEVGAAMSDILGLFNFLMLPFSKAFENLPLPPIRNFHRARARLDATIYRMIADRRASGRDHGDLLSLLLLAQDTEGDGTAMSDQQVRDEAMTLFIAGHETTANALTWTWYLLSQNPGVEAKLHGEVDSVLGRGAAARLPRADDFPNLPYTEMVFTEAMRLYPPAWAIGRRALRDVEIAGYHIPSKSVVVVSPWVMHRDARFYPEPERFDPQRWTPESRAARPKYSYFPFGAGPRQCIGEPFAWMEGVLLLATIAQRWRLRLAPGQRVEIHPQITLRPKYGMRMIASQRH